MLEAPNHGDLPRPGVETTLERSKHEEARSPGVSKAIQISFKRAMMAVKKAFEKALGGSWSAWRMKWSPCQRPRESLSFSRTLGGGLYGVKSRGPQGPGSLVSVGHRLRLPMALRKRAGPLEVEFGRERRCTQALARSVSESSLSPTLPCLGDRAWSEPERFLCTRA